MLKVLKMVSEMLEHLGAHLVGMLLNEGAPELLMSTLIIFTGQSPAPCASRRSLRLDGHDLECGLRAAERAPRMGRIGSFSTNFSCRNRPGRQQILQELFRLAQS